MGHDVGSSHNHSVSRHADSTTDWGTRRATQTSLIAICKSSGSIDRNCSFTDVAVDSSASSRVDAALAERWASYALPINCTVEPIHAWWASGRISGRTSSTLRSTSTKLTHCGCYIDKISSSALATGSIVAWAALNTICWGTGHRALSIFKSKALSAAETVGNLIGIATHTEGTLTWHAGAIASRKVVEGCSAESTSAISVAAEAGSLAHDTRSVGASSEGTKTIWTEVRRSANEAITDWAISTSCWANQGEARIAHVTRTAGLAWLTIGNIASHARISKGGKGQIEGGVAATAVVIGIAVSAAYDRAELRAGGIAVEGHVSKNTSGTSLNTSITRCASDTVGNTTILSATWVVKYRIRVVGLVGGTTANGAIVLRETAWRASAWPIRKQSEGRHTLWAHVISWACLTVADGAVETHIDVTVESEASSTLETYSSILLAHIGSTVSRAERWARALNQVEVCIASLTEACSRAFHTVRNGAEDANRANKLEWVKTCWALVVSATFLTIGDVANNTGHVHGKTEGRIAQTTDVIWRTCLTVGHSAWEGSTGTVVQLIQGLASSTYSRRWTISTKFDIACYTCAIECLEPTDTSHAEVGGVTASAIVDVAADTFSIHSQKTLIAAGANQGISLASSRLTICIIADKLASIVDKIIPSNTIQAYIRPWTADTIWDVAHNTLVRGAQSEASRTVITHVSCWASLTVGDVTSNTQSALSTETWHTLHADVILATTNRTVFYGVTKEAFSLEWSVACNTDIADSLTDSTTTSDAIGSGARWSLA